MCGKREWLGGLAAVAVQLVLGFVDLEVLRSIPCSCLLFFPPFFLAENFLSMRKCRTNNNVLFFNPARGLVVNQLAIKIVEFEPLTFWGTAYDSISSP